MLLDQAHRAIEQFADGCLADRLDPLGGPSADVLVHLLGLSQLGLGPPQGLRCDDETSAADEISAGESATADGLLAHPSPGVRSRRTESLLMGSSFSQEPSFHLEA